MENLLKRIYGVHTKIRNDKRCISLEMFIRIAPSHIGTPSLCFIGSDG